MRIAVVTSYARGAGRNGEDIAVGDQIELLRSAGHDVLEVSRSTDEEAGKVGYAIRAGFTVATGIGPSPLPALKGFRPDVVHVHNTYPNFGRNWVRHSPYPLVVTLHSFRLFCANGMFYRDQHICTDCLTTPMAATRHGCYEGPIRSLPYSAAALRRRSDRLLNNADRIITLNPTMRDLLLAQGVDEQRVVLGTNTTIDASEHTAADGKAHGSVGEDAPWLYVGRLLEAKGIVRLLKAWPRGVPLRVIGDGPASAAVDELAGPEVSVSGWQTRAEVRAEMARARGLIVPSLWFEGQPLVYVEALSCGLPTLAFEPNAAARLVAEEGTGIATNWDDVLADVLDRAAGDFPHLRTRCTEVFEQRYSNAAYLANLQTTYLEAVAHRERNERLQS